MTLAARISTLVTRIANYFRDSILPRLLPSGGSLGQVLGKTGGADYGVGWKNINSGFSLERVLNTAIPTTNNFEGRLIQREDGVIMQYRAGSINGWINVISDLGVDESENSILVAASTFQLNSAFSDYTALSIKHSFGQNLKTLDVSNGMIAGSGNVVAVTPGPTISGSGLNSYIIVNTGIPRSMLVINLNNNQYTITNLKNGDVLLPKQLPNGDLTYHVIPSDVVKNTCTRYTSSGTYTKPVGLKYIDVLAIPGGNGGGSGSVSVTGTQNSGGAGGAGAGYMTYTRIMADKIGATETITVGLGGAGGAAKTVAGNGNLGSVGGTTSFGALVVATNPSGAGSAGSTSASATAGVASTSANKIGGTSGGAGNMAAAGGNGNAQAALITTGATGGGGGGGITTANVVANGGNGGNFGMGTTLLGGLGSTASNGNNSPIGEVGSGGGGSPSSLGTSLAGGNGGLFGGGGGGSGGARVASGKGGDGGPGVLVIVEYF
jgi:hypothetical protein